MISDIDMGNKTAVITVVLNAEKTIERALKSVLDQTYTDLEYIVVDGGSTDGTLKIIEDYKPLFEDKGVKFTCHSGKDNGIYDAMNKGLSMVSSDAGWVNFLNADDYYADERVLEELFPSQYDESVGAIYGDSIILRENGQQYRKSASDIDSINYKCPFVHQALFVRYGIIRNYPFSMKWRLASDYEQWVRMYIHGVQYEYIKRDIIVFDASGASGKAYNEYVKEMLLIQSEYKLTGKYKIKRLVRNRIIPVLKNSRLVYFLYASGRKTGAL